ncbi:C-_U-editing enzyme APOBEC-1-like isoform X2 [Pelodiscus sinensis]|uniref:C->U-editing enzyme APOBEC-1-like isoform X2 n=1 Tax=Pelodiscus sinensis TaxID=13735 RepID=UPI003F6D96C9
MTAGTEKDGSARGTNPGWKIQSNDFKENYNPGTTPKVTYLLYEMKWGRSKKFWRQWCKSNTAQHAEVVCLERDFKTAEFRPSVRCSITWFLSWSPCGECCHCIVEFLKAHPSVTLKIRFARVFRREDECNQQGIRNLMKNGVDIDIMKLKDYRYCWRTFVAHQNRKEGNFWPWFRQIVFYGLAHQRDRWDSLCCQQDISEHHQHRQSRPVRQLVPNAITRV